MTDDVRIRTLRAANNPYIHRPKADEFYPREARWMTQ